MRGRPSLYTRYDSEMGLFPSMTKKVSIGLFALIAILAPLAALPFLGYLGDSSWLILINRGLVFAVAALGLNLLTGVAGQVSLGHAFFMAVGAYTAVVLGGEAGKTVWGLGLPIWVWLPAAGIVAALVGIFVSPTAVRVRGLYLPSGFKFQVSGLPLPLPSGFQAQRRKLCVMPLLSATKKNALIDEFQDYACKYLTSSAHTTTYLTICTL